MAATSLHSLHLPRRHRLFRHQSTHLSSSPPLLTFDSLSSHLSASNFRQADEETRRLLISLAGEPAQKRGYVFFSEVQFISSADLLAIDDLWLSHSGGRLGYSVQRKVWEKSLRDFTKFFINVGWMRRLETEVEQFGYRSFPEEFMWELKDEMPDGHLPLTNALRGTQLLGSILMHPAFELEEEDGGEKNEDKERGDGLSSKRLMKPDYSF